jgi:hypothetical protein
MEKEDNKVIFGLFLGLFKGLLRILGGLFVRGGGLRGLEVLDFWRTRA